MDQTAKPVQHEQATQERIFWAALDLFSQESYDGVSIRDITRAVGIKESSFYNHYTSKAELLEAILLFFHNEQARTFPPEEQLERFLAAGRTPREFFLGAIERFKQAMTSPHMRQALRVVNLEQYRNPTARQLILDDVLQKPLDLYERVFRVWIERGQIRTYDPRILANEYHFTMFSMMHSFLVLDNAGMDTAIVEQQMLEHVDFFSKMIEPQK